MPAVPTAFLSAAAISTRFWLTPLVLAASSTLQAIDLGAGNSLHLLAWALPRWLGILHATVEMGIAAWLFSSWARPLQRPIMLTVFLLFLVLHAAGTVLGMDSCSCFGTLAVSDLAVAAIDAVIVLMWLPSGRRPAPWAWLPLPFILCALALPSLLVLRTPMMVPTDGQAVVVVSDAAAASPADDLAGLRDLSHGRWAVICYSDTCAHCQEVLPHWIDLVRRRQRAPGGRSWAFVAIGEPHGGDLVIPGMLPAMVPQWRIRHAGISDLPCALLLDGGRLVGRWDQVP